MSNTLTITLDNNSRGFYHPNQVISGSVEVEIIHEHFKGRCIRLNLKGKDFCKIPAGRHTLLGIDKFLNCTTLLRGSEDDMIVLRKGVHSFPFAFQLPSWIPCSAVGPFGYIRYKLEAILKIPWALNLRNVLEFTVHRFEDLRYFPELGIPIEREHLKTYHTWLCQPKLFKIKTRLPKSGYALGETIPLNVELINNSATNINFTRITFKRIDKFTSDSEAIKISKINIWESRYTGVDANDAVSFEVFIPLRQDMVITNNRYSKKFKIFYEIRLRAETGFFKLCPTMYIPITIGTVGFES